MDMHGKWLPDGRGFSPDGGWFRCVGNAVQWDDGEITYLSDGVFRATMMPTEPTPFGDEYKSVTRGVE